MIARELIKKLLDFDPNADVVFEMLFDDEGEPELFEVNDIFQVLPPPEEKDAYPLIVLSEQEPALIQDFNLN